jgi:hypothetical protein
MDNDEKNSSQDSPLLSLRTEGAMVPRRVEVHHIDISSKKVFVRSKHDRRRQFFRRWTLRGMDELRKRQANIEPPDPGMSLDEQI